MEIYSIPLNKGETCCCTIKEVKNFFKHTDITVGYNNFKNFNKLDSGIKLSALKKLNGKIVCKFRVTTGRKGAYLSFYVLKEDEYSEELHKEFCDNYLPQLYDFYNKHVEDMSVQRCQFMMLIELLDGKLFKHVFPTSAIVNIME